MIEADHQGPRLSEGNAVWLWRSAPTWPEHPHGFVPDASWVPDWSWPPPPKDHVWWWRTPPVQVSEHIPTYEDEDFEAPNLEEIAPIWVPPSHWPSTPEGWTPPPGWRPDPSWGEVPQGWVFWREDEQSRRRLERLALRDQARRILLNTASPTRQVLMLNRLERALLGVKHAFHHDAIPPRVLVQAQTYMASDHPDSLRYRNSYRRYVRSLVTQRDKLLACLASGNTPGVDYVNAARASSFLLSTWMERRTTYLWRQFTAFAGSNPSSDAIAQYQQSFDRQMYAPFEYAGWGPQRDEGRFGEPSTPDLKSWVEAEKLATNTLQRAGYTDAVLTQAGSDGGVDVLGSEIVAQVKYHAKPVGRPDLQKLVGANTQNLQAAFFSRSGYTQLAVEYASSTRMALFRIELPASVIPENEKARQVLQRTNN